MDDQDNKTGSGVQSPAPAAGRPLTAEDVALLRKGDVLRRRDGTVVTLMIDGLPDASYGEDFIGRPDADGWIFNPEGWAENPVPGTTVEYRCRSGSTWALPVSVPSEALRWGNSGWSGDIIAFRLSRPASEQPVEAIGAGREEKLHPHAQPFESYPDLALHIERMAMSGVIGSLISWEAFLRELNAALSPASPEAIGAGREEIARVIRDRAQIGGTDWRRNAHGADINAEELADLIAALSASPTRTPMGGWPEVTDQWAETYCELTGRDPDGQQVTFVDGGTVTTFRDVAKREIEAMLCAAPKSAVRTIATAEPAEARIRELERQLRIVQNAAKTLHHCRDTELQHLRENATFDHRLRAEHESLMERDAMMTDLLEQAEARATAAEARNAELSMLAYRWMEAHDRLKAGENYDLPSPADLPAAEAQLAKAKEALEKTRDHFDFLVRLSSGTVVFEIVHGKRTRRKLAEVVASEADEGSKFARQTLAALQQEGE